MSTLKNISLAFLSLGIACSTTLGYAADIDIYSRPPVTATDPNLNPNILIVIDNSANWASAAQHWPGGIKQGEAELNAIRTVIGEVGSTVNVGLMMFTPGTGAAKDGGYVRFHVRQMTPTNKSALSELIGYPSGCTDGPNSLNGTPNCILKNFNGPDEKVGTAKTDYSAAMLDAFKYFGGYTWPAHAQDDVAGANINASQFGTLRYSGDPDPKSDPAAYSTEGLKASYMSPLSSANNCSKNYIIFIGNGFPTQDSPSTLLGPPSLLPSQGVGGNVTQLPVVNLVATTTTQSTLLATPACGTYPGATAALSLAACNADATLSTTYPGYTGYSCSSNSTCSAGSTTTTTTLLGTSACGVYSTQAACLAASPWTFSGYTSYSCSSATPCTSTSTNSTNPIVASTGCISTNLSSATACTNYGNTNYPGYSGFSCTASNCSPNVGGSKQWRIDATTRVTTGNTYSMNGLTTSTVTASSFSQNIYGTSTSTAAASDGTFSAPSSINHFDEWARFLHQTDVSPAPGKQNINMFTIDVFKDQQDLNETKLLISAAEAGGGKYFKASNEDAITNALRKIFAEIQAVNSVFASSSLPVSVNTQGTYLNQVFMGMFRPEGGASPRWPGNLKQYKFKIFNGVLRLADKNGDEAISTTTGFVTPCANSYWSTDTGQYWNYGSSLALGDCTAETSLFPATGSPSLYSDGPDGEVVEKGGSAQRLRGTYSSGGTLVSSSTKYNVCSGLDTPSTADCRMLKTCDGTSASSCTAFTSFDTSNAAIDATALNLSDATQRDSLIEWARGKDVDNENANLDGSLLPITAEMRPSVHGGVVHSQPAVIDYGGSTGTIAFYGADDGMFHAVDGGQSDSEGTELWGFIPPETIGKLNRLRTNSPLVAFPGISGSPVPMPKDYFFDGSIGVFQRSGSVWIFPSMRRGGRSIYAFDVSNPADPVLKWRKGCFTNDTTNDTVCSTDATFTSAWASIGQTWSAPKVAYLNGYVDGSGIAKPILIFGGGYDTCEDTNSQTRCVATPRKGANIWFVDADTGAILRTYPTAYSVAGDLSPLKDTNGYLTKVYASDTGGNVYRINVGSVDSTGSTFTSWTNNSASTDIIIASMSVTNHARKFLNGPSVVPSANYNAVLLGSGDREHPLVTDYACGDPQYNVSTGALIPQTAGTYVTNQFYMLIDKPAAGYPSPVVTPSLLVDVKSGTTTFDPATNTITNVTGGVTTTSTKGWRFDLGLCEQTVNEALTIAGSTFFGTNAPSSNTSNTCVANLGNARGYKVDFLTGMGTSVNYTGGGMPPSPVAGVVDVDGTKYPFCIGCIDPDDTEASALQGGKVIIEPPATRSRAFWYIEKD